VEGLNVGDGVSQIKVGVELAVPVVDGRHVSGEVSNHACKVTHIVDRVFDTSELGSVGVHN